MQLESRKMHYLAACWIFVLWLWWGSRSRNRIQRRWGQSVGVHGTRREARNEIGAAFLPRCIQFRVEINATLFPGKWATACITNVCMQLMSRIPGKAIRGSDVFHEQCRQNVVFSWREAGRCGRIAEAVFQGRPASCHYKKYISDVQSNLNGNCQLRLLKGNFAVLELLARFEYNFISLIPLNLSLKSLKHRYLVSWLELCVE